MDVPHRQRGHALATAGLRLEFLREYDFTPIPMLPAMHRHDDGMWRLPADGWRIPLLFSLRASKDG